MKIPVRDIVKVTRGRLCSGDPAAQIDPAKISTDSRAIGNGGFFIALKGANFDGNNFVEEALRNGAIGAITSSGVRSEICRGKTVIQVADTTRALQDIAGYNRSRFSIPVVCVTGSNGKTTVKDLAWRLLSTKYTVLRNEGTRNNHIGVPQTLLKLDVKHDICVLELGTNHKGEIDLLARIAQPTVAVITNIGPSHLEFLDDLNGVFNAKKEILKHLKSRDGLIILNGDDGFLRKIKSRNRSIRYGFGDVNDMRAEAMPSRSNGIAFLVNGSMVFVAGLLGRHNIYNALAAITVAMNFGISYRAMKKALADYKPAGMRLEPARISGVEILNDAYNSNPSSMMRAVETLSGYPARARWVVSGDMLELGKGSAGFHRTIGESIAKLGIDGLVTYGELSRQTLEQASASGMSRDRLWHCSTHEEIARVLKRVAKNGDVVLLKGSRGMAMEKVLKLLKDK